MSRKHENRKLFWLPFTGFSLLIVVFVVSLAVMLETWLYSNTDKELARIVDVTLNSINSVNAGADEMDIVADSIGLATSNIRVSILDKTGQILGDSLNQTSTYYTLDMESAQPEIKQALANGNAKLTRYSRYLNQKAYIHAQYFKTTSFEGLIRVSMPVAELEKTVVKLRTLLFGFATGALLLGGLLVIIFVRRLKNSVKDEHRLLEQRVVERTREIEMLQRLASMLAACSTIKEVDAVVKDIIPKIIGPIPCAVALRHDGQSKLTVEINWQADWPGALEYSQDDCWALRKGRYHLSTDLHSTLTCEHMHGIDTPTMCIPLLAHGQPIGILHLLLEDEQIIDKNIIFTIAEHLGLALANLNMQSRLREQAIRDPLTKLFNRRYLDEVIEVEINRSLRHDETFSVLLIDIDFFKKFNDEFGHDAGDFVLKNMANLLTQMVRKEDIVCRIGGEEFLIILPETDIQNAQIVARKLNHQVKAENWFFAGQSLGRITISIGISGFGLNGKEPDSIFKAADIALYAAKNNGRDQFKTATSLMSEKVLDLKVKDS